MVSKESTSQCRKCEFNPWVRKITWNRNWQPTPTVFLPGKSHVQRSLMGYSLEGLYESGTDVHSTLKKSPSFLFYFSFYCEKRLMNRLLSVTFLIYFVTQIMPDLSRESSFKMISGSFRHTFFFSLSTSSFSVKHVSGSSYTFPVPPPESAISSDYCISF